MPPLSAKEDSLDQGWFLNACQQALTKKIEAPKTAFNSGYCYGYLEGLRHTGKIANDFVTQPELWGRQLWCIPEEESLEAVTQAIIAELKIPPGTGKASYPAAVMKSLKKRYPCP
ncbi:conserved hypothetical protein [Nitrosococcus halophilus Nc 4]|uniref:Rap1a immunity protein domain-containing protein n=1 Tax=Nitrosococcus halophilus (strain Nc4) TaxID=472759 RepID=D5BXL2_NITHN|nr:Rap1a/Tai family immunity protein [Nitrosococcus halophilus]ADE13970.1 conserved hypothetical protein [Nitrosococcus halophilus Nc 4]